MLRHAVTDHPARHDLSIPATGRFRRAPHDASSARLARSESHRGGPRDQSRAEQPALRPRTPSAITWRSRVSTAARRSCSFESIVSLEHSPADASDLALEAAERFSRRLQRRGDAGPRPLHRAPSCRSGRRGRALGASIPARQRRSIGTLELLVRLSQGIHPASATGGARPRASSSRSRRCASATAAAATSPC